MGMVTTNPTNDSAAPVNNVAEAFARNLIAGTRLAFARPIRGSDFVLGVRDLAFALLVLWAVALLVARLAAGAQAEFWTWGLIAVAARLYLWLSAVALLCWLAGHAGAVVAVITATLYASAPLLLFSGVLAVLATALDATPVDRYRDLFDQALLLWCVLVFWRVLVLTTAAVAPRRAGAAFGYAGMLMLAGQTLPHAPLFYVAAPTPPQNDIEATYYRQASLLQDQIDQLAAQRPSAIDMYFIGYAGFGAQDVFMRETLATRSIVERRLGLHRRTLALVNNPATVDTLPLANLPNLRRATAALAEVIDREQDIVFLFLTSHGSEDASLAAEAGALQPNDLYAEGVRGALDDAGIRWRVIVVSACYSGSFIEALRSPTTLIITAAAANRSSFGCSHENAWTYFGQAYFAEALNETRDLVRAFEHARGIIRQREKREGKRASHPQISLGREIRRHLQSWRVQATLDSGGRSQ